MIRLALRVARRDAEMVLADLLELAPSGVEEIELPAEDGGEALVEYAVYGAPGELPDLPDLRAAAAGALVEVSTKEVPEDWSERWKEFHKPVLIQAPVEPVRDPRSIVGAVADGRHAPSARTDAASLYVRPPWEESSENGDALEIVIDPAQAFGTGAHATTRLCLELLLELAASNDARPAVLDVGSGSGVLAIAAVKLGYGPVLALDNDRESVRAILSNAAVNGVEIEARRFDLRREALPWLAGDLDEEGVPVGLSAGASSGRIMRKETGTVVLANLLRPLLLDMADTMPIPTGTSSAASSARLDLIASGLLCEQADEVAAAFAKRLGLHERARREQGEWAALWLTSARSPREPSP